MNNAPSITAPRPHRSGRKKDLLCALLILAAAAFVIPAYLRSHRKETLRFQQVVKKSLPAGSKIEKWVSADGGDYFEVTMSEDEFAATFPDHEGEILPLTDENAERFKTEAAKVMGTAPKLPRAARYYRDKHVQIVRDSTTGRTLICNNI